MNVVQTNGVSIFSLNYSFSYQLGHNLGDEWNLSFVPSFGRYAQFTNPITDSTNQISFGDIDGIYGNTILTVNPNSSNILISGNYGPYGHLGPIFQANTSAPYIGMGDLNNNYSHMKFVLRNSDSFINGFNGYYSFISVFSGSLDDLSLQKNNYTGPILIPVNYTVTITTTGTPDLFDWSDDQGNFGSGIAIINSPIELSYGVKINFTYTSGHSMSDQWSFYYEHQYGRMLYTNGSNRTFQIGDLSNIGNSTWLKLDDKKSTIDVNGIYGITFSGISPSVSGSLILTEYLDQPYFPFSYTFLGPVPTNYTVLIDGTTFQSITVSGIINIGDQLTQTSGTNSGTVGNVISNNGSSPYIWIVQIVGFAGNGLGFENGESWSDSPASTTGSFTSAGSMYDTFSWADDQSNSDSNVPITGGAQSLSYNVQIQFSAHYGSVLGDNWSFGYSMGYSRMMTLNGGNDLIPGGYMSIGDVDGAISGTQIMIIPEFGIIGQLGNIFQQQQQNTCPAYTIEAFSGSSTFGTFIISSGVDGNPGEEASISFGSSTDFQNNFWRVGANIFDSGDSSFGIATDNIGYVLQADNSTGAISFNNGAYIFPTNGQYGKLYNDGSNNLIWDSLGNYPVDLNNTTFPSGIFGTVQGLYRVSYYISTDVIGGVGERVYVSVQWTDPNNATVQTLVSANQDLTTLTGVVQGSFIIHCDGSNNITWGTAGLVITATFNISMRIEKI